MSKRCVEITLCSEVTAEFAKNCKCVNEFTLFASNNLLICYLNVRANSF